MLSLGLKKIQKREDIFINYNLGNGPAADEFRAAIYDKVQMED